MTIYNKKIKQTLDIFQGFNFHVYGVCCAKSQFKYCSDLWSNWAD